MNSQEFLGIGAWILDGATALGTCVFFYAFLKKREKDWGLYMILILTLIDLLFPIQSLLTLVFPPNSENVNRWAFSISFIYTFAQYWSTLIAIFVYIILKSKVPFEPKPFIIWGAICCAVMSVILGLTLSLNAWGVQEGYQGASVFQTELPTGLFNKISYFVLYSGIGIFLPVFITSYCYFHVFQTLKEIDSQTGSQNKPFRVLWYCLIQIFCFVPTPIMQFAYAFTVSGVPPLTASIIISCLHRAWGMLNLLAYWFLNPAYDDKAYSVSRASSFALSRQLTHWEFE